MTPCPYHPKCSMTLEQWQKSESNRVRALTIKKGKGSLGAFQDPAGPFGSLSSLPFGSSSRYAASMTSATIDFEVKCQVELARCMDQEINPRVEQELQRVPCYAAKSKPYPTIESERDKDNCSEDEVFQHQPTYASAFNNLPQLKEPSNKVCYHFPILFCCLIVFLFSLHTLSLLPIFAVDFCVPGQCQLAARFPDLRNA